MPAIPAESLFLPAAGRGTLQQRIQEMVAEGVLSGRYRAGDKLPSSRGLAQHLGVSRITVTLAYTELVASDYLTARGRSGYFVSDNAPHAPKFAEKTGRAPEAVDFMALTGGRFSSQISLRKPDDWRDFPYPFIYGQTDPSLFDHQNWRQCALRALGRREFEPLTVDYYERDDPLLIEYISRTILPRRGIDARPDEVLLTMGAQNGLWLAAQVLLGPGRRAAIENPGYPGLRSILNLVPGEILPVDIDDGGLRPEALPPAVDVVFTTPSHQSPTNATLSLDRRRALLAKASAENFLIVEDDYEFEMSFLKSVSPALKSLDPQGRVIYVGSFSKSLFPGLRLGYMVGPASFIREARGLRATVLRHPPGHIQRTVAYFLSLGHYDALVNRMRAAFKRRRMVMDEAIRAEGLTVAGPGGFGGSSFWMQAPEGVDTEALARHLRGVGVLIEPGREFFDPARASHRHYRIAYSSIAQNRIPEGISRLAAMIRRLQAEGPDLALRGH